MIEENYKTCEKIIENIKNKKIIENIKNKDKNIMENIKCLAKIHYDQYYKYRFGIPDSFSGDHDKKMAFKDAARKGHVECVKIFIENNFPYDTEIAKEAAETGQIDCLKCLYENNYEFDSNVINMAIIKRHYDCMKYLHEIGCKWNIESSLLAVSADNVKFLEYAHQNGCVLTTRCYEHISDKCIIPILKYLLKHKCPINKRFVSIVPSFSKLSIRYENDNYLNIVVEDIFNIICSYIFQTSV